MFLQLDSSQDEVATPNKNQSKVDDSIDLSDDIHVKRSLVDEFSTNAPGKKTRMVIKQEKD